VDCVYKLYSIFNLPSVALQGSKTHSILCVP
jgi:hypothetical protein